MAIDASDIISMTMVARPAAGTRQRFESNMSYKVDFNSYLNINVKRVYRKDELVVITDAIQSLLERCINLNDRMQGTDSNKISRYVAQYVGIYECVEYNIFVIKSKSITAVNYFF